MVISDNSMIRAEERLFTASSSLPPTELQKAKVNELRQAVDSLLAGMNDGQN